MSFLTQERLQLLLRELVAETFAMSYRQWNMITLNVHKVNRWLIWTVKFLIRLHKCAVLSKSSQFTRYHMTNLSQTVTQIHMIINMNHSKYNLVSTWTKSCGNEVMEYHSPLFQYFSLVPIWGNHLIFASQETSLLQNKNESN